MNTTKTSIHLFHELTNWAQQPVYKNTGSRGNFTNKLKFTFLIQLLPQPFSNQIFTFKAVFSNTQFFFKSTEFIIALSARFSRTYFNVSSQRFLLF